MPGGLGATGQRPRGAGQQGARLRPPDAPQRRGRGAGGGLTRWQARVRGSRARRRPGLPMGGGGPAGPQRGSLGRGEGRGGPGKGRANATRMEAQDQGSRGRGQRGPERREPARERGQRPEGETGPSGGSPGGARGLTGGQRRSGLGQPEPSRRPGTSTWISAFTSRSNLTISWLQIRTWTSWAAAMLETPATGSGGGQVQTRFRAARPCASAPWRPARGPRGWRRRVQDFPRHVGGSRPRLFVWS